MERRADPVKDRGGSIAPISVTFSIIATTVVLLRLYTRLAIVRSPGWEDWILLAASICSIIMAALLVQQVRHGLGKHTYDLSTTEVVTISKYFWVENIFYTLALGLTKISIVAQYLRIFQSTRATRIACICALCFLVTALSQAFLLSIFTCTPISNFWTSPQLAGCINLTKLYVAQSSLNIFSDLVVILLPVPIIKSLKMSKKERYALLAIFALASFGCITTVVRLFYVLKYSDEADITWNNIDPMTWSALEVFVAIICAALPALRKAVQRVFPRLLQGSSHLSATRPSEPDIDFSAASASANARKNRITMETFQDPRPVSKDGDVAPLTKADSRDDVEALSDQQYDRQYESHEAASLSESERNILSRP